MITKLFLDASYLIALELSNDQNHQLALSHWQTLDKKMINLVTTSYIFDEVVTFFNSRFLHQKAVEVGQKLITSNKIQLVHIDENLFFQGWDIFQKYEDKSYSLTDCISFVVMQKLGINEVLTFDNHFRQAGFQKLPD